MTVPDDAIWPSFAWLLADGEPVMNAQMTFRIFSRALHLLFAIMLGGGLFYMRSVLAPSGAEAAFAGRRGVWMRWVMVASTFLLVSGMYNYLTIVWAAKEPGAKALPTTYHILFAIKFALGLAVMFIASVVSGSSALADRARANLSRWLNIAWTCIMAIVIVGATMRMLHP
jgi:putative copper export protein